MPQLRTPLFFFLIPSTTTASLHTTASICEYMFCVFWASPLSHLPEVRNSLASSSARKSCLILRCLICQIMSFKLAIPSLEFVRPREFERPDAFVTPFPASVTPFAWLDGFSPPWARAVESDGARELGIGSVDGKSADAAFFGTESESCLASSCLTAAWFRV